MRGMRDATPVHPRPAGWKSLPKQRKTAEKGRDSNSRRLKISTQTAEIGRKGRESRTSLSEISTQTAEITEALKAENQMLWVQRMNNLRNAATEIVSSELIYC